jgi:hypothetical protein
LGATNMAKPNRPQVSQRPLLNVFMELDDMT